MAQKKEFRRFFCTTIRTGQEIRCLPYAGYFLAQFGTPVSYLGKCNIFCSSKPATDTLSLMSASTKKGKLADNTSVLI